MFLAFWGDLNSERREVASVIKLKYARQVKPLVALIRWGKHLFSTHIWSIIFTDAIWTLCDTHSARRRHSTLILESRRKSSALCFCDGQVSFQPVLTPQVVWVVVSRQMAFGSSSSLELNGCVIVYDAQLLFQFMWKMHNCNKYAEEEKHCNHVIHFQLYVW